VIDAISEVAVERVYYCAGSSFVTGSDIAQVLLDYARWVAVRGEVDVIAVPTLAADGSFGRISILLTATTQLSAETMYWGDAELTDPEFVGRVRADVIRLSSPMHSVAAEIAPAAVDAAYDL
jgi:hypothetical protein